MLRAAGVGGVIAGRPGTGHRTGHEAPPRQQRRRGTAPVPHETEDARHRLVIEGAFGSGKTSASVLGDPPEHERKGGPRILALAAGDWSALGWHVRRRRMQLGLSQERLATEGSLSVALVRLVEGAARDRYAVAKLAGLERALGWAEGAVVDVLRGGQPRELPRIAHAPEVVHLPVLLPEGLTRSQRARAVAELAAFVQRQADLLAPAADDEDDLEDDLDDDPVR